MIRARSPPPPASGGACGASKPAFSPSKSLGIPSAPMLSHPRLARRGSLGGAGHVGGVVGQAGGAGAPPARCDGVPARASAAPRP
jgi:hypothetical protein